MSKWLVKCRYLYYHSQSNTYPYNYEVRALTGDIAADLISNGLIFCGEPMAVTVEVIAVQPISEWTERYYAKP